MHEKLCFAGQNVSRIRCGEACPADGCGTRSVLPGPCSDRPRSGTPIVQASLSQFQLSKFEGNLARKLLQPFGIWRKSRTKASFSQLHLLKFERNLAWRLRFHSFNCWNFEGNLPRKLRFHIFNTWNLKEISHESFVFISSTVGIWRKSRTKCVFER